MNAGELKVVLKLDDGKFKASLLDAEGNVKSFGGEANKTVKSVDKADNALVGLAKNGAKYAAVGLAGLAATITGLTISGGISRALNIEDAQAKLRGLGHDAGSVQAIMNNALASVKGTAFGLDAAATTAAGAVAAGIKPGKQLEKVLKTVANSAALAGTDMGEMGAIFNKVATSNKVQMDVINQLQDRGIPVLQFLSKEMGVSAEETAKLASAGKINFEVFARAMEKGVGNAADEMGKTTRGSWSNLLAALSRIGAGIVSGPIESVRLGFGWLTEFIDNHSKEIIGTVSSVFDTFKLLATGNFKGGMFGGALQEDSKYVDLLFKIRDSIGKVKDVMGDMGSTLAKGDYTKLGEQIGKGLAKSVELAFKGLSFGLDTFKGWFSGINWGQLGMEVGKNALGFILGLVVGIFSPEAFNAAIDFIANNWGVVLLSALSIALLPAKFLGPIGGFLSKIAGPVGKMFSNLIVSPLRSLGEPIRMAVQGIFKIFTGSAAGAASVVSNIFRTIGMFIISPIKIGIDFIANLIWSIPLTVQQMFGALLNVAKAGLSLVWDAFVSVFSPAATWFGGIFRGAWGAIMAAFSGVRAFFSGVWNSIVSIFGRIGVAVGDAIGGAFKSVVNSILRGAVGIINGFIKALNSAINIINKIPGVKIGKLGELGIPQLATGGIVTAPTLAMIGEGSESEAVLPLSKLKALLNDNSSSNESSSDTPQIQQNNYINTEVDMNIVNRSLMREARRATP